MIRYFIFVFLLFNSLVSLSQQYSEDYTVAEFKETYLEDLKTEKINPKSIENLLIINLGFEDQAYISSLPIKKLNNLKKLYLGGDDYDYDLREIPMAFLRLKSLKIIILQNVAYTFRIINQVKKYRPDITVKVIEFESTIKFLKYDVIESGWDIKVVYPNKIISHNGFAIDSILHKKELNSYDYIILAQTYIHDNSSQKMEEFIILDSLYQIYGDSMYGYVPYPRPHISSADTLKAIDYLNKAIALNDTSYSIIYYACYFYQRLIRDKDNFCYYYKKLQTMPPPHDILFYSTNNPHGIYIGPYIKEDDLEECNF